MSKKSEALKFSKCAISQVLCFSSFLRALILFPKHWAGLKREGKQTFLASFVTPTCLLVEDSVIELHSQKHLKLPLTRENKQYRLRRGDHNKARGTSSLEKSVGLRTPQDCCGPSRSLQVSERHS
jgi:hypothetical protein